MQACSGDEESAIRLLILYTRLASYTVACLREFRSRTGAETLAFNWSTDRDAPFDAAAFAAAGPVKPRIGETARSLLAAARDFRPDAVLVSGWRDAAYVRVCRSLKADGVPVISGCDTQWTGSLRQRAASAVAPWHVHRFIDVLWVTGERQRALAAVLGYRGDQCWDGFYACDVEAFASAASVERSMIPPAFLFVGRYVPEKGIATLSAAYRAYRTHVNDPWPLIVAGAGPLGHLLVAAGADDRGFVQPSALPALLAEASAFILPSSFEPWGVVLQEAAATGLPLIASNACGASVHLLRSGFNGYLVEGGDVTGLCDAMLTMHRLSPAERATLGKASLALSKQYTPTLWAATLAKGMHRLQA